MKKVLKYWLSNQCKRLSGSTQALLLTGPPGKGSYDQALLWPENRSDPSVLSGIAQAALSSKKAVVKTRNNTVENTGEPLCALACPLHAGGQLFGVVAIEMTHRSQPMQKAIVRQVHSGAKWLETMIQLQGSTANELATRFACQRVSLGFLRYKRIRVEAMSHSTRIDQQSNKIRAIRDAMGETLDQGATIVFPAESAEWVLVTQFHSQLAKEQQGVAICTLPLVKNNKAVGALLLERTADSPFTAETVEQCEQIGLLLGPVLENRRRDQLLLPSKIYESLQRWCGNLFDHRNLPLKAGVALSAALVTWLSLAMATFRIASDVEVIVPAEMFGCIVPGMTGTIVPDFQNTASGWLL